MEALAALRNNAFDTDRRSMQLSEITRGADRSEIWELKSDWFGCCIRAYELFHFSLISGFLKGLLQAIPHLVMACQQFVWRRGIV